MSPRETLRAFATWQRGKVRFLASAEATRVYAQAKCGGGRWWHSSGGVGREQLERAAGVGLSIEFRASTACAWNDGNRHRITIDAARARELLVALDAALEAGLPARRKPAQLGTPPAQP